MANAGCAPIGLAYASFVRPPVCGLPSLPFLPPSMPRCFFSPRLTARSLRVPSLPCAQAYVTPVDEARGGLGYITRVAGASFMTVEAFASCSSASQRFVPFPGYASVVLPRACGLSSCLARKCNVCAIARRVSWHRLLLSTRVLAAPSCLFSACSFPPCSLAWSSFGCVGVGRQQVAAAHAAQRQLHAVDHAARAVVLPR